MDADTVRTVAEIEKNGYITPGTTMGDWGLFYAMSEYRGHIWKTFILYLESDSEPIEFKAIDDESALQYAYDTFVEGTRFELFERICEYRKIDENQ